ncbi:MAG: heavy metal translocating P-type ATPase [Opitutales bacterium]
MSSHSAHSHDTTDTCESGSSSCDHCCGHDPRLPARSLIAVSGLMVGLGLLLEWFGGVPGWAVLAAHALATLAGGLLVFPAAFKAALRFNLNMNVLMTVAVAGAWIIGEQAEGAAVVFLFALSEWLESMAGERGNNAIRSLMSLAPETALRRREDGGSEEVPAREVSVGETILVRSGQRIPLDGEVSDGNSAVDQAPITGESIPVEKEAGDPVFAGTVNGEGTLTVRVTKPADDSTLSRIIQLVSEAEKTRAPTQRFVDRFAAVYTPAVFAVAILTALIPPLLMGQAWDEWIYRALALLVIACPCALVISTPVSIVSGLTALARRGVLVKGGTHLESLGKLKALAVDKTGTITEGRPKVVEIVALEKVTESEVLSLAASIDQHSEHPIARAVVAHAEERALRFSESDAYRAITGQGAEAKIDGSDYFIGNHRMAHASGLCGEAVESQLAAFEQRGLSVAILGRYAEGDSRESGTLLGIIAIGDRMRPDARQALAAIHRAGIEQVIMLSGDNQRTVDAIASEAGIDQAFGDLLPDDKVTRLRELLEKYKHVGMIGDGVNDAPALAIASVGIAMGAIGSDTAIETADVALMKDDLTKLAFAIQLGRRTLGMIRFNITFALLVKAVFLVLTFSGHASLWLAILADTGATLLVVANSLRLLKSK